MKRAREWRGDLSKFLEGYKYQPGLTKDLDRIRSRPFDQELVNEIVLWKVNRYAQIGPVALARLNALTKLAPSSHRKGRTALNLLLHEHGIDLPMASTLLRFRNPRVFQIFDRRAYRAIYGR